MPALRRHGRAILKIWRLALGFFAAASIISPANAQGLFDPMTAAYALCVTHGVRKLALEEPPHSKNYIVEHAFGGCHDLESELRKSLLDKGMSRHEIGERLAVIKKFIRQTAPDDIDRYRVNNARPR